MATTAITIRSSGVGGGSSPQQEHEDPLILRIAASLGHAAVITRGDGRKRNEISDSEGSAVMRLGRVLLGVAVLLNVAVPQVASSQMKSPPGDRKSTRLNSSHSQISYAVFCLKKKKIYTLNNVLAEHC